MKQTIYITCEFCYDGHDQHIAEVEMELCNKCDDLSKDVCNNCLGIACDLHYENIHKSVDLA